jgi:hypothetical protein
MKRGVCKPEFKSALATTETRKPPHEQASCRSIANPRPHAAIYSTRCTRELNRRPPSLSPQSAAWVATQWQVIDNQHAGPAADLDACPAEA